MAADGSTLRSQVVFPVERGPKRKKDLSGKT